jgi:Helix-turn-helix domain
MATKTQRTKLVKRLSSGKNLTVAEASSKFGIKRLAARIHELREEGFPIYTNTVVVKGGKNTGKKVTAYRLNVDRTPSSLIDSAE